MRTPAELGVGDLDHSKFPLHVGIIGSRSFDSGQKRIDVYADILRFVNKLSPEVEIVSGGAVGVDTYAEEISKTLHVRLKVFLPNTSLSSPERFHKRNREIVTYLKEKNGVLVAFIMEGNHRGSSNTIRFARTSGVPRLTFFYDKQGKFKTIYCDPSLVKTFTRDDGELNDM